MRPRLRRALPLCAVAAALLLTACVPAIVGGGIFVAGVGATLLVSGCDEAAAVQVWDHTSAYPVCDAVVTAEQEGSVVTFSPCYQAYLGTGVWKVTAQKPGMPIATGTIVVDKERRCSEPSFHSLDLTLGTDGEAAAPTAPPRPPAARPYLPPPPPAPADTGVTPAPSAPAPQGAPAPSASVPAAAFPTTPPTGDVPPPPTR